MLLGLRRLALPFAVLAVSSSAAFGCSSSDGANPPATPDAPDAEAQKPAPKEVDAGVDSGPPKPPPVPTFPQVESRGGAVIHTPKVVPIVFSGDPLASDITEFTQKIAASKFWADTGKEYGVGPITVGDTVTIDTPPASSLTSGDIETWLASQLTGDTPALGAPDPNTLYAVYYPQGVSITLDQGGGAQGQSCQGYGGYHFEINAGGTQVGYAVLPRCSGIDELTVAASHEYFEWATDPFPQTDPAYQKLDDAHWAWQVVMLGELGDLCTFMDRDYLHPSEIGFTVQRMWSNELSKNGAFPCAPAKAEPYVQAIPTAEDEVEVPALDPNDPNATVTTQSINVPRGETRTVDVFAYSDGPKAGTVPLRAMSYSDLFRSGPPSEFTYTLELSYPDIGSVTHLDIKAPNARTYDVLVMVSYVNDRSAHFWPVLVTSEDPPKKSNAAAGSAPQAMPADVAAKMRAVFAKNVRIPTTRLGMDRARVMKELAPPAIK